VRDLKRFSLIFEEPDPRKWETCTDPVRIKSLLFRQLQKSGLRPFCLAGGI
jgi:hypothetical protein